MCTQFITNTFLRNKLKQLIKTLILNVILKTVERELIHGYYHSITGKDLNGDVWIVFEEPTTDTINGEAYTISFIYRASNGYKVYFSEDGTILVTSR